MSPVKHCHWPCEQVYVVTGGGGAGGGGPNMSGFSGFFSSGGIMREYGHGKGIFYLIFIKSYQIKGKNMFKKIFVFLP